VAAAALKVGLISEPMGCCAPRPGAPCRLRPLHPCRDIGAPWIWRPARTCRSPRARHCDQAAWASKFNETEIVTIGALSLYVIHDVAQLGLDPGAAAIDVVVFGHSHKPAAERRQGVLFVNPGSAGPRRFRLPVSVGRLTLGRRRVEARLIELQPIGE